ncbi:uncharacterized protein C5orf34 homolog isoform X2 [Rhinatrema bivittatum]|uniref:uncharacterized protein C5orf34 homolog isoform X2 n=1 Tax=Rhinatrema bivittatum TaxID=194408 RepID=UPI00112739C6|nr:uncharacterized protein C5orf34 homolog isoform X2 [Rhinatrema bivittatum]
MKPEGFFVLYDDDSVDVYNSDGSNLHLSPCGSEFLIEKALPALAHPLQQPERIRQRTQFVISSYKSHPSNISEVRWPSLDDDGCVICLENGIFKVSALDSRAHLYMPELQQDFTVEFLCKVSQMAMLPFNSEEKKTNFSKDNIFEKSVQTCKLTAESEEPNMKNKENDPCCNAAKEGKEPKLPLYSIGRDEFPQSFTKQDLRYTWVVQHCSVSACPEEWKYPLSLVLNYYHSSALHKTEGNDTQTGVTKATRSALTKKEDKKRTVTVLPRALPLSCCASYLHRWSFGDLLPQKKQDLEEYFHPGLLKVVWYRGITYRFFHGTMNSVEIYPGDGSVFISQGTSLGHYFIFYSVQLGTQKREEKMYAVSNLPPDIPGYHYSVRSVITHALRMLEHCYKAKLSLNQKITCCWRESLIGEDGRLPVLLEQTIIPNLGRFTAYSDSKIFVTFCDGVTLQMIWDFSFCYGQTQGHDTNSIPTAYKTLQEAAVGWCQLIFPDGGSQLIQIDCPGYYASYVQTATAWCRWLNEHAQSPVPAPSIEENWSATAEVEKIKRFQFLLENSNIPRHNSTTKNIEHIRTNKIYLPEDSALPEQTDAKSIVAVLEKTSKTIQDIECLLSSPSFRK